MSQGWTYRYELVVYPMAKKLYLWRFRMVQHELYPCSCGTWGLLLASFLVVVYGVGSVLDVYWQQFQKIYQEISLRNFGTTCHPRPRIKGGRGQHTDFLDLELEPIHPLEVAPINCGEVVIHTDTDYGDGIRIKA